MQVLKSVDTETEELQAMTSRDPRHMTDYELQQARKYLQQDVLVLRRVEGVSSTSVKVVWDVSLY